MGPAARGGMTLSCDVAITGAASAASRWPAALLRGRVVLSAPHDATASSAVARLAQNAAAAEPAAWVIADNADPALRGDPDEVRARLSEHIPLRRYGEPEEFGRAAAFVLSPAASYITGAVIPVDGGAISSI